MKFKCRYRSFGTDALGGDFDVTEELVVEASSELEVRRIVDRKALNSVDWEGYYGPPIVEILEISTAS